MAIIKYLNPRNDIAFKKIFGTEKNKDVLIYFLNDVIITGENRPNYAAKAYASQPEKGDKTYEHLKAVIFLAITEYDMFPKKKGYKSDHVI